MPQHTLSATPKVLVTGGAGFIGSHSVELLVGHGFKVRVLDDFSTGREAHLGRVRDQIEVLRGDIRDLETCAQAMQGVDFVLHQAALSSVPRSVEDPAATIAVNVQGSTNVFQAARDAGVRRLVYASSASVYGTGAALPNREGNEGRLLSAYALSKSMTERLAGLFSSYYGMQLVGLRYFNVYGPRQNPTGAYAAAVPRFFANCAAGRAPVVYGSGEQTRDFVYVEDVAQANLAAIRADPVESAPYNVGTATRCSVRELAQAIAALTGYDGPIEYAPERSDEVLHSCADLSRFTLAFGRPMTTTLSEGLAKMAPFYQHS